MLSSLFSELVVNMVDKEDDIEVFVHPPPVKSPAWGYVKVALDTIHLLISFLLMLGAFLLPIEFMVLILVSTIVLFFRYHDYCYVSEVTSLAREFHLGCREKYKFANSVSQFYADYLGFVPNSKDMENVGTFFFALNALVALGRLAIYYRIVIFPNIFAVIWAVSALAIWFVYEFYSTFFYEPLPFCSAVSEIRLPNQE